MIVVEDKVITGTDTNCVTVEGSVMKMLLMSGRMVLMTTAGVGATEVKVADSLSTTVLTTPGKVLVTVTVPTGLIMRDTLTVPVVTLMNRIVLLEMAVPGTVLVDERTVTAGGKVVVAVTLTVSVSVVVTVTVDVCALTVAKKTELANKRIASNLLIELLFFKLKKEYNI